MNTFIALLLLCPLVRSQDPSNDRAVRVLDLSGTPHERGLEHGREPAQEIREMVADFKLERTYGVEASIFIESFLAETDFEPAIEEWTPCLARAPTRARAPPTPSRSSRSAFEPGR